MTHSAYFLAFTYMVTLFAAAHDVREHSDLRLAQQQMTIVEQLADHASRESIGNSSARYHFDYLRFAADLQRMRQGIHNYLSPSRAQPADLVELSGDYRVETINSSRSYEHD
jgi:RAQPRD family integrative conjugative element protein